MLFHGDKEHSKKRKSRLVAVIVQSKTQFCLNHTNVGSRHHQIVTNNMLQDFDDPLSEHLYDHDYIFWSGDLNYRIQLGNDEVSTVCSYTCRVLDNSLNSVIK